MLFRPLIVAATMLMTVSAVAQQPSHSPAAMPVASGSPSPADRAMMRGMSAMSEAMSKAPMTGDSDHDFVAMMIPHHQGAVDMANVELQYGKDPTLRRLAASIVAAQENEIAEMRRWQAEHPNH